MAHLVSVIVPIYNMEIYLNRCVDSLLDQTYANLEVILVNDGSVDNSGRICDEYKNLDNRVKVVHKTNGGLSSARNAGIDVAQGDYLCFIDSDDYVSTEMIEVLYGLVSKFDCDISECGFYDVHLSQEVTPSKFGKGVESGSDLFMLERFLDEDLFNGVVTKMYRSDLFKDVRFPMGRIFEEIYLTLFFCLDYLSYARTDEPLYYYVHRENSILQSGLTPRKAREYILILENMLSMIANKVNNTKLQDTISYRIHERNVLSFIALATSGNKSVRVLYSRLYGRRLDFSITKCVFSKRISFRNKISYILCKLRLGGFMYWVKERIRG